MSEKKKESRKKRGSSKKTDGGGDADDFDVWMKSRQLAKPDDQLELTEAELNEEITKVLTTNNTNVLKNLVIYSFKHGEFVSVPPEGNTVQLLGFPGHSIHMDSEEAKLQMEETGEIGFPLPAPRYSVGTFKTEQAPLGEEEEDLGEGEGEMEKMGDVEDTEVEAEGEEEEEAEEEEEGGKAEGAVEAADDTEHHEGDEQATGIQAPVVSTKKRKLVNQFNFCERAALTYTNPSRSVDTQTIPPPQAQFGDNVLQWNIFDSYAEDYEIQQREQQKREDKKAKLHKPKKGHEKKLEAEELNIKYLKCWQILERMINQNIFDDISNDYRYWDDPADEYRDGEGTLLPLWKFQYERTKRMNVTDVVFNPYYYDLFAVCFGSYDFMKQIQEGCVCLFTIKNPSYPDYIIVTESGVMCCDIHPNYPFLIVIGMYDGNVAVHDLREHYQKPLYVSVGVNCKHSDCVWEIKWGPDMVDGEINFFSISTDGRVCNWILMQHKLTQTVITTLFLEDGITAGPDGTDVLLKGCGSCMKFHPTDPQIYLVGTEEGNIYKCSTAYSSKYLMTYLAHNVTVYRIDFNRYNSNIFISCSGDWRIKVWEDMRADPLFIFDLGAAVGDVKWAPFSSTVFGACTTEGKVFIFDLNVNKYKPICVQAVVPKRKNRLTRLAFNEKLPFIIVGDDKGGTTSLKLSPNLRIMVKPPKKQLYLDQRTLQIQKLDKLLSLVRELPEGEVVPDTTATAQS